MRRLLVYVWCLLAAVLRLSWRLSTNVLLRRRQSLGVIFSRTVAELFQALGPTYLKLGQLLASRADLIGQEFFEQLVPLFDQLPPIPLEHVREIWQSEFGESLETTFEQFEPLPVASGSVASVFRARLRGGRMVAVKIQRPGLVQVAEADFLFLRLGARFVSLFPPFHYLPVRESVDEMISCIRGQFDFGREVESCNRVRAALVWESSVVVPEIIDHLCGKRVLTMRLVEGLIPQQRLVDAGRQDALRSALQAFYRLVFVEGLVHCDLHPGNLYLLSNGAAVLLDFGFTAELSEHDRLRFAEFFFAMATGDGQCCADIAVKMAATIPAHFDALAFEADISQVVDEAHGSLVKDFQVGRFVAGMFDVQRRHRLKSTTAFTMVALGLLVFEGLINQVDPELDFQQVAQPYIFRASVIGVV
ncbi:MAG: AarF/ABC1/UbiB kinase family protein [Planctomycetales bacterium]|nr:AarF/ABC1/UbiB kinase family protein [Planctomycetales bacterium]